MMEKFRAVSFLTILSTSLLFSEYTHADFVVNGTFKYRDRPAGYSSAYVDRPIRFAKIEVYDEEAGEDTLLASTETDGNGFFACMISDDGSRDIYVKCSAVSDAATVTRSNGQVFGLVTSTEENHNGYMFLEFGTQTTNDDEYNQAFNILDQMVRGYNFVNYFTNAPPAITVRYEENYNPDPSHYDGTYIHIQDVEADPDGFDDCVILHEYGHFLADKLSCDWSPGGTHYFCEVSSNELAWSEAWAYLLQSLVRDRFSESGTFAFQYYRDYSKIALGLQFDLDDKGCTGANVEGAVVQGLWDIFDSNNDANDNLTMGDEEIWDTFDNMNDSMDCDINDFISVWVLRGYSAGSGFKEIFQDHGIWTSPTIRMPPGILFLLLDDD